MIAIIVYILCAVTALGCALMLARGYKASGTRLLFWSAVCFAGLTIANILLVVDLVLVPYQDLSMVRSLVTLVSGIVLLSGLVSETTS